MFEPDCTIADLRENIDFIRQYPRVPLNFCRTEVYGGTELHRRLAAQGRLIGDYFGYSYRISDPSSQLAFEIFREVFSPRNFDCGGMNLMAMSVAYNLQILKHFFPAQATAGVVGRAQEWIADLNASNIELMSELLDFADSTPAQTPVAAFTADLAVRRAKIDARLARRASAVLAEIAAGAARAAPAGETPTTGRMVSQAASVAAAAILVSMVGCKGKSTHTYEMAPQPANRPATSNPPGPSCMEFEMAAPPGHQMPDSRAEHRLVILVANQSFVGQAWDQEVRAKINAGISGAHVGTEWELIFAGNDSSILVPSPNPAPLTEGNRSRYLQAVATLETGAAVDMLPALRQALEFAKAQTSCGATISLMTDCGVDLARARELIAQYRRRKNPFAINTYRFGQTDKATAAALYAIAEENGGKYHTSGDQSPQWQTGLEESLATISKLDFDNVELRLC